AVRPGQHHDRYQHAGGAQQATELPPIHVGQTDIKDDRIEAFAIDRLQRLRGSSALVADELLMQLELLCERLTQRVIIVDDQNSATSSHHNPRGAALRPRGYPGSGPSSSPNAALTLHDPYASFQRTPRHGGGG